MLNFFFSFFCINHNIRCNLDPYVMITTLFLNWGEHKLYICKALLFFSFLFLCLINVRLFLHKRLLHNIDFFLFKNLFYNVNSYKHTFPVVQNDENKKIFLLDKCDFLLYKITGNKEQISKSRKIRPCFNYIIPPGRIVLFYNMLYNIS